VTATGSSYKGFRFPPEIISHCVWLYHRFPLSFRDVQELMFERGVDVSYETIRAWCDRFGPQYANQLCRRGPRPGDKWHLDEVFVQINGAQWYLWRAVDEHGTVLDILVQSRRNAVAARKFFRRLLTGLRYVPRVIVTDKRPDLRGCVRGGQRRGSAAATPPPNKAIDTAAVPTAPAPIIMSVFTCAPPPGRFLLCPMRYSPRTGLLRRPSPMVVMTASRRSRLLSKCR
jgi:putative transposase